MLPKYLTDLAKQAERGNKESAVFSLAGMGWFNHLPPEHAPERFVFPWQPLPKFSEALRAQETP